MKRNDCLKELKWRAALLTVLTLIATVALVFFLFCFIEAFSLLFTHGSFTLPAIATTFFIWAFLAFALVGGAK